MPIIRVKTGPSKGMVYEVKKDSEIIIGRDEVDGIQVFDQAASRRHSKIYRVGEMYFIQDLESRNGTFINEEQIEEELLRVGDKIRIGNTMLLFEDASPEALEVSTPQKIKFTTAPSDPSRTLEFRWEGLVIDDAQEFSEPFERQGSASDSRALQVLYSLSKVLATEVDLEKLMQKVVKIGLEATVADHAYIFIKEDSKPELNLAASYDKDPAQVDTVSKAIIKRAIKYTRPVLTSNASTDERFSSRKSVIMKKIRSVICVPLAAMEKLSGVIYLSNNRAGESFKREDLELVSSIAIQTSIAIQRLQASQKMRLNFLNAIRILLAAIEARSFIIPGHSERIATYALAIGRVLKLSPQEMFNLEVSAYLHDLGVLAMNEDRMSELQDSEGDPHDSVTFAQAMEAERLLRHMPGLEGILPSIYHANEYYDGTGMPDGLEGDDVPMNSRIIMVARVFDRLLTKLKIEDPAASAKTALMEITKPGGDNSRIDPMIVKALVVAYRDGILFTPDEELPSGVMDEMSLE
ncbi:MAG: HD domain-containing phosphohydrolase [Planctomycetota bacterium]|jgi:response regulator RpfG family c-di-GMP phosphodiesterase/pSer/pThr/pTyr-binding forkhead associated (FHA) protein